jgi:short-subunit dehydrogenase
MAFAEKVAVITGASSGIGWEVAKLLAREKCHLGLVARRKERLDALADECRAHGVKAVAVSADVSERAQVFQAVEAIRSQLGPIDLLLANSGVGLPTTLEPMNLDEVDAMMKVNYCGVVYAVQAVLPEMMKRGQGHIAAISSLASYKALPGEGVYCSSKIAVNYFLEGLRIQLKKRGIATTVICPGFVHTPMTELNTFKMPWVMTAEKAAGHVLYALRKRKKVYNFPWQTTMLMRLTRWLPDFVISYFLKDITIDKPKSRPKETAP